MKENLCELLDEDRFSSPEDFLEEEGYEYFDMNREYDDQVTNESCLLIPVKMKKIELKLKIRSCLTFLPSSTVIKNCFFLIPSRLRPMIAFYLSTFIGADGEVHDGIVLTGF